MCGVDGYVVLDGQACRPLGRAASGYVTQGMEQQRMMGHDHIGRKAYGLAHHVLRHVQTQ